MSEVTIKLAVRRRRKNVSRKEKKRYLYILCITVAVRRKRNSFPVMSKRREERFCTFA